MTVAWFGASRHKAALRDADRASPGSVPAATPAVSRTLMHPPAGTHDPNLDDGRPAALVRELYFDDVAGLHCAQGHLQILAAPDGLPSLCDAAATQLMRVRAFPVPEPRQSPAMCTYLVAYEGTADDLDAWVTHYTTHHTARMAHFPRIREIEVGTQLDWRHALSWAHVNRMLRNKVVFDDPSGLRAALNSPVRHDMRANDATCRKFTGPATHYPMHAAVVGRSHLAGGVAACQRRG